MAAMETGATSTMRNPTSGTLLGRLLKCTRPGSTPEAREGQYVSSGCGGQGRKRKSCSARKVKCKTKRRRRTHDPGTRLWRRIRDRHCGHVSELRVASSASMFNFALFTPGPRPTKASACLSLRIHLPPPRSCIQLLVFRYSTRTLSFHFSLILPESTTMAFDDLDVNAFFDFDAATDEELEGNDKSNEVDTAWSTRDPSEILALLPSTSPFLAPLNMGGYSTNTTPPATSSSSSSSSSQAPSSVPGTPQTAEGENLSSEDTMEASSGGPPEAGDEHAQSTHQADHNSPPGEIPAPLARPTTRSMRRLAATRLTAQRTAGTDRSDRENTAAVKREPTPTTPSGSQGTTATKRKRSSREDEGPVAGPSSVTLDDLDAEQSSTKSERAAPKKPRHRRTKEEVDADQKRACTATKCGLDGGCDWILTDDTRRNKKHLRDNHYAGGRAGATIDAGTSSSATQSQATGTLRCSWGTTEGQCGRTYSGATPLANLERHVEGHHWGRQLVCDRCGQAFDRVWLLTRHKKSCGKGKDRDDKDADDEEQPPQKKRRR